MKIKGKGTSMIPLIKSGATIVFDTHPSQYYKAGDIVAYIDKRGGYPAHRIIRSTGTSSGGRQYLLKGDYNFMPDGYVDEKYVLGKVQKIIYPSYDIDLTAPLSLYISRLIACFGEITAVCRWFYSIERIAVFCLSSALISGARLKTFRKGKK